ncbi:hypothetical protein EJB05_36749, partial [Eragrostis curvula]
MPPLLSSPIMEEASIERAPPTPQLLNLIRDEWKVREADDEGRSRNTSADAEDTKLELKLGLPGVQGEERAAGPGEKTEHEESYTALSLGSFHTHSKLTTNTATTGAKRGFLATVDAKPEGCNQRHRDREGCENELTLGGEDMAGERKKGCCPPSSSHDSAAGPVQQQQQPPGERHCSSSSGLATGPILQRNLTNGSSSKESPERQNNEAGDKAKLDCKRSPLVKINMDGIPIGRKINLAAYDSFHKLSSAIEIYFVAFLKDLACTGSREQGEEKIFSGLLDGTGEYTLVYEANGGGRMLAGDLSWSVFVSTAKRLRVMRSSELPVA